MQETFCKYPKFPHFCILKNLVFGKAAFSSNYESWFWPQWSPKLGDLL